MQDKKGDGNKSNGEGNNSDFNQDDDDGKSHQHVSLTQHCFDLGLVSDLDSDSEREPRTMEYCDPCYCYGKCCLDVVASILCVSLL